MDNQTLIEAFVIFTGLLMSVGYLPQIIKIFRRKSVADISPITFLILAFGMSVWLVYGFYISDKPLIVTNTTALAFITTILVQYFLYRKKKT